MWSVQTGTGCRQRPKDPIRSSVSPGTHLKPPRPPGWGGGGTASLKVGIPTAKLLPPFIELSTPQFSLTTYYFLGLQITTPNYETFSIQNYLQRASKFFYKLSIQRISCISLDSVKTNTAFNWPNFAFSLEMTAPIFLTSNGADQS